MAMSLYTCTASAQTVKIIGEWSFSRVGADHATRWPRNLTPASCRQVGAAARKNRIVPFVNEKLFPYLAGFKTRHADAPNTIEYKIGQIFGEIRNKITSGYNRQVPRVGVDRLGVHHPRRGSRLYDGKDYFTIHDFVKAHHHFNDPEWDGEPIAPPEPEPRVCSRCGQQPCVCEVGPPEPCPECGKRPCECPQEPCEVCGQRPCVCKRKRKIKVKLADGKERQIQHMVGTSFWHADGTPMSAEQFLVSLFGAIPEFFKDEAQLRTLWADPTTRRVLLDGLAERGFGRDQLAEMQRIIDAEQSDIFDVLAYVAFNLPPVSREQRAALARAAIEQRFDSNQVAFLSFVLAQYVRVGVDELSPEKLAPLLKLRYHNAIADAVADLGPPERIVDAFTSFQRYLYA